MKRRDYSKHLLLMLHTRHKHKLQGKIKTHT
jgi:hypothetical protein